jgi:hypothetical protein
MINNLELFLKESNTLLSEMFEYNRITDKLIETDLNYEDVSHAIDEIATLIHEREEVRERAATAQDALLRAIEAQSQDDVELIKYSFNGQEAQYSLSGDKKLAAEVVFKLLAMQKEIIDKDGEVLDKLKSKRDEIMVSLKNSQGDKKRLEFLNLTATTEKQDFGFNV